MVALSEKMNRPVARMPGFTQLIEDQNGVIKRLNSGFSSQQEYMDWVIDAASVSLGFWPHKEDNPFENIHVIEMVLDEDVDMSRRLRFELSKQLIDIYQKSQAYILMKMKEEDTTDKLRRNKMEGIK